VEPSRKKVYINSGSQLEKIQASYRDIRAFMPFASRGIIHSIEKRYISSSNKTYGRVIARTYYSEKLEVDRA
jgi:hypothetical protein